MNKTKKNLFLLTILPLLLTGCNKSVTKLPNKGTEISAEEGKAQLKRAYSVDAAPKEDSASDAIGISVKDVNFGISGDISISSSGKATGAKIKESASDFGLEIAAKGFTGKKADDLELYARGKGKLSYDVTVSGLTTNVSSSDEINLDASRYCDNDNFYFDLSNSNLGKILGPLFSSTVLDPGKYKVVNPHKVTDDERPLISVEDCDGIDYSEFEEFLINGADKGVFKSHGHDVYSYSYSYTGAEMNSYIKKSLRNAIDKANSDGIKIPITEADIDKARKRVSFDDSTELSFAAIFNSKKGIQSIASVRNYKVNFDSGTELDANTNIKGSLEEKNSYKIEFTRGKDVVLHGVSDSDKANYKEITKSDEHDNRFPDIGF